MKPTQRFKEELLRLDKEDKPLAHLTASVGAEIPAYIELQLNRADTKKTAQIVALYKAMLDHEVEGDLTATEYMAFNLGMLCAAHASLEGVDFSNTKHTPDYRVKKGGEYLDKAIEIVCDEVAAQHFVTNNK